MISLRACLMITFVCCWCLFIGHAFPEINGAMTTVQDYQNQDQDSSKSAEKQDELIPVELADGAIKFKAPKAWKQIEPRFSMIEAEFAMQLEDEEKNELTDGRLTIMRSGGGVAGNIQRWYGQFAQPDGKRTEDVAEVEELEIDGVKVHWVDIAGSYKGGPGSSGEVLDDYRMLGAIIETEAMGDYFLKFYGPAPIVDAHLERFKKFVHSMTVEK